MKKDSRGYFREKGMYRNAPYDFRAKTKVRLREKVQKFMDEVDAGILDTNTTVQQWSERWLETYKKPMVGAPRFYNYKATVKQLNEQLGSRKLSDVHPADLQDMLNALDCTKSHAKHVRSVWRQIFHAARQNHLVSSDPTEFLQIPMLTDGTHRPITDYERTLILDCCDGHRASVWVLFMLFCGLRPAEAAALQWCDVDFSAKTVRVTKAIERMTGNIKLPKSKSGIRTVPLPDELIRRLYALNAVDSPFEYVTVNSLGNSHTAVSMKTMWQSFRRHINEKHGGKFYRAKLIVDILPKDLTPYCLRHTYCTDLQAAGVPINVAKELMGHADISVTAKIYTHPSGIATQNALDKINALHRGTVSGTSEDTLPANRDDIGIC